MNTTYRPATAADTGQVPNRTIFCKDNLDIMKGINTESIDLIYLDPPFNKNKTFTAPMGSAAEGAEFKDYFRKDDIKEDWVRDIKEDEDCQPVYEFLETIERLNSLGNKGKNNHYVYNYCYLTQKPLALLERIIKASCPEGGLVLDPFCGSGTTCVAAEKLGRQWIGIDVSEKAYELVKLRLAKEVTPNLKKTKTGKDISHPEAMLNWEKKTRFKIDPPKRTDQGVDYREKKYVYIMEDPRSPGWYKVGIAKDWRRRLSTYQTGDRRRAWSMPFTFLTPNFREVERLTHERFDAEGEWVKAELDDIKKFVEGLGEQAKAKQPC